MEATRQQQSPQRRKGKKESSRAAGQAEYNSSTVKAEPTYTHSQVYATQMQQMGQPGIQLGNTGKHYISMNSPKFA